MSSKKRFHSKRYTAAVIAALLLAIVFTGCGGGGGGGGSTSGGAGSISGFVHDKFTPTLMIPGATVSVSGIAPTTTAANGTFLLTGVPAGSVTLNASKAGYKSVQVSVTVNAGATTANVAVPLEETGPPPPP